MMGATTATPIPTGPDDVQTRGSYWRGNIQPALNVKVYGSVRDLSAETFARIGSDSDDETIAGMTGEELRDATIAALESMYDRGEYWPDQVAAERGWEDAQEVATELFGPMGYNVKVWSDGRSGGWLVIDGLPDPTDDDAWREEDDDHDRGEWLDIAPVWAQFAERCAELVENVPYDVAWNLIVNAPQEVTGRVVDVTIRMVLAPEDVDREETGTDPHEWDWRALLDVSRDTTIHVRDNRATGNAGKFRPV